MLTTLPPELQQYIQSQLAEGYFKTEEEVISEGLRLMQRRDQLSEMVRAGLEDIEQGNVTNINNEEESRAFFDSIKSRGMDNLRRKRG
ncbi:MAG: type II toxin-antitoxin system ParD family antitoxin [Planctomycetota bacterium]|nr:type II toxin-antitoxin system ParD family antitoxin [Planctomycetota bacterium]MDA1140703.1 type II toxin-antitoxin system ParD family antitoxin [Planctomycetota bacterium]